MSIISRILFFLLWVAPALAANPALVSGTANSGIGTLTGMTVTSNGSVAAGDIMIVTILPVTATAAPTAITPPSGGGWSTAVATTAVGSSAAAAAIFYKQQAVAGLFSDSFTWTGTAVGALWTFSEWSGVNTATPLDGVPTTSQNASSASPTTPSITPSPGNTSDTLIGILFGSAIGVAVTVTSAMTSVQAIGELTTAPLTGTASLSLASADPTASGTWTLSSPQVTLGVSLLLQPADACTPVNLLGVGC